MSSSECIFEFDHTNKVYFSGETINGRVKLHTTKAKQVKSAYLLFEGRSKVRWYVEKHGTRENNYKKFNEIHSGDEVFINERINIFTEGRLPAGLHTYTFSIPLPLKCRTSCTEKYGEIIYVMSLVIERELTYNNVFSQPITVIKPLDLNSNPDFLLPLEGEDVKYICCFPCSSGPILSTLTIPYGSWAPGQDISYTLNINNQTRFYNIKSLKLQFEQIFKFTVEYPVKETRTHTNALCDLPTENRIVLHGTTREMKGKIRIPPVPPTLDSGIINISYRLGVLMRTGDWHLDSDIWVPITIGTIPLTQTVINENAEIDGAASDLPPSYDLCTPATFEEPTHIGEKFRDTDRDEFNNFVNWLPKYPVYNKFNDDLSSQIGWSPDMTAHHTNLFTSEISATAPELDALTSESSELLKNESFLESDYNPSYAPTNSQCPPYDESFYVTEVPSGGEEYVEINMLPDDGESNEITDSPHNDLCNVVTNLSDNNENNEIANSPTLPDDNQINEVTNSSNLTDNNENNEVTNSSNLSENYQSEEVTNSPTLPDIVQTAEENNQNDE